MVILRAVQLLVAIIFLVFRLGLARLGLLFRSAKVRAEEGPRRVGRILASFCEGQGATFIKFAQILSTRPDLLSPEITDGLKRLQDGVRTVSFVKMRKVIESDLGRSISDAFANFAEEPIASASIAQVYKGTLKSGQVAAVKVMRPGVARRMQQDFAIMGALAKLGELLPQLRSMRLSEQLGHISKSVTAQADFALERANNRRLAKGFANTPWVRLPEIYDDYCGAHVITMEFIDGMKLPAWLATNPPHRQRDAERLYSVYLQMAYRIFALHADLHPGNLLIDRQGCFVIIDTGLVIDVHREYLRRFVRLSFAFATLNASHLLMAYFEGQPPPKELPTVQKELEKIFDGYRGKALGEIEFARIGLDLLALLRLHRVPVDPQLTMLFVADTVFEGMALMVDPKVDILTLIQTQIMELAEEGSWLKPEDLVFDETDDTAPVAVAHSA